MLVTLANIIKILDTKSVFVTLSSTYPSGLSLRCSLGGFFYDL